MYSRGVADACTSNTAAMWTRRRFLTTASAAAAAGRARGSTSLSASLSAGDEAFLEDLSRRAFLYFWEQSDARTGLALDRTHALDAHELDERSYRARIDVHFVHGSLTFSPVGRSVRASCRLRIVTIQFAKDRQPVSSARPDPAAVHRRTRRHFRSGHARRSNIRRDKVHPSGPTRDNPPPSRALLWRRRRRDSRARIPSG